MDPEFKRIDRLLHDGDPEEAWIAVLDYLSRNGLNHERWAEVATLTEDLIYVHADLYIDRIEREAISNTPFRSAVMQAYIGGIVGPAVDRFLALQERLRAGR
jgi:hypothetical protein